MSPLTPAPFAKTALSSRCIATTTRCHWPPVPRYLSAASLGAPSQASTLRGASTTAVPDRTDHHTLHPLLRLRANDAAFAANATEHGSEGDLAPALILVNYKLRTGLVEALWFNASVRACPKKQKHFLPGASCMGLASFQNEGGSAWRFSSVSDSFWIHLTPCLCQMRVCADGAINRLYEAIHAARSKPACSSLREMSLVALRACDSV